MKKELKDQKKNQSDSKIKGFKERIKKQEKAFNKREENMGIATSTSKTNYNDPRITVAWCKRLEVPIEKIFTKVLIEKFTWSMSTTSQWKF